MGTRGDFYVGRGPDAEWLGSVTWDGDPGGVGHDQSDLFDHGTVEQYRERVQSFLEFRRPDSTFASEFWPWPWDDSDSTDFAFAFDDGKVFASSFGHPWFEVDMEAEYCGEPQDEETGDPAVFPDMSGRRGTEEQIMAASGLMSLSTTPHGQAVIHAHSRKDLDAPQHRYAAVPGHPLAQVPLAALEAAREAYKLASRDGSAANEEMIEPIADAVLMAALPHLKES